MHARANAVKALLESRLSKDGDRGAATVAMVTDMVGRALRGDIHQYHHILRRDLLKAVGATTGRAADRMLMEDLDRRSAGRQYPVDYFDSLATRIRERHWSRLQAGFKNAHGEKSWGKAKDEVWTALNADARPYGLKAWDNSDDAPRNTPGENLLTTLFYFVSFATLGDGEAMESMSNLVRLLPYAVPIGEWRDHAGHWVYVIHSVR